MYAVRVGEVIGCTDIAANNYNVEANVPCDSCCVMPEPVKGMEGTSPYGLELKAGEILVRVNIPGKHDVLMYDVNGAVFARETVSGKGLHSFKLKAHLGVTIVKVGNKSFELVKKNVRF